MLFIYFLLLYLYSILNKYLDISFNSIYFWSSIRLVFCKFENLNYTIAKIYYSITLLNILRKTFEFIFTKKITYLVKTYKLFSYNFFNIR